MSIRAVRSIDPCRQPSWRPAADVVWCTHGDTTFLLSIAGAAYHTLDGVGAQIWSRLCDGVPLAAIAAQLEALYGPGAPKAEDILCDIGDLILDLKARGLVQPGAPAPKPALASDTTHDQRPHERRPHEPGASGRRLWPSSRRIPPASPLPSVLTGLCYLALVHVLLKTIGLSRVLRHIFAKAPAGADAALSAHEITAITNQVGKALVWYPFHAACLEHSVCLLWMIRRAGGNADLRLGVQPFPFAAHAWLELNGVPLNDSAERIAMFKPFPAIRLEGV